MPANGRRDLIRRLKVKCNVYRKVLRNLLCRRTGMKTTGAPSEGKYDSKIVT